MGLREKLNEHPLVIAAVVGLVIVIGVYVAYSTTSSGGSSSTPPMFLSTDDGATWFKGKPGQIPPIKQSDGKVAVQVHLFKCGAGEPFAGYLEKYTDEAKTILDNAVSGKDTKPNLAMLQAAATRGLLVKRPSDKDWSPGHSAAVKDVTCPDKTKATEVRR